MNGIVKRRIGFIALLLLLAILWLSPHINAFAYTQLITNPITGTTTAYNDFQTHYLPAHNGVFVNTFILIPLYIILFILFLYVVRHFLLAADRLFGVQHNMYGEIIEANWPSVTILIPAHNEETVIADILSNMTKVEYPRELLQVIVINDRSTDSTGTIVDEFVKQYPGLIHHFNRKEGAPGKAAALLDSMPLVKNAITLVFDADYIPNPFLIKELAAPFFDPEVGSVMGRVVPGNIGANLLTRLIDIERTGGYQVNQQARENWHAIPQYGGTAGGVRTQALVEVGGWDGNVLAEDTEITFRLFANNWLVAYQNNAECIEMVPETWSSRIKQIKRWAKGHNHVMYKYFFSTLFNNQLGAFARYDGVLLLGLYLISPLLVLGWLLFLLAYLLGAVPGASGILAFILLITFSGAGNFTIFYEIAIALHLDNLKGVRGTRIRLLPFIYMSFFVCMFAISMAFLEQITVDRFRKHLVWDRTYHPSRK